MAKNSARARAQGPGPGTTAHTKDSEFLGAQAQAIDHSLSQSCSEQAALRATRVGFYEFVETKNYLVLVCVVFPSCSMQLCVWGPQNYIKCPVQANRGVRH